MLGEKIETLETKMVLSHDRRILESINLLKHEISDLGRYIRPAREMIMSLVKLDSDFITSKNNSLSCTCVTDILSSGE